MQYVPEALSNCALLVKVKGSVDVDAVLENQKQNYDVYVCAEKGVIATASIFSTAGMHSSAKILSQLMPLQVFLVDATGAVSCTLSFSPQSCVSK